MKLEVVKYKSLTNNTLNLNGNCILISGEIGTGKTHTLEAIQIAYIAYSCYLSKTDTNYKDIKVNYQYYDIVSDFMQENSYRNNFSELELILTPEEDENPQLQFKIYNDINDKEAIKITSINLTQETTNTIYTFTYDDLIKISNTYTYHTFLIMCEFIKINTLERIKEIVDDFNNHVLKPINKIIIINELEKVKQQVESLPYFDRDNMYQFPDELELRYVMQLYHYSEEDNGKIEIEKDKNKYRALAFEDMISFIFELFNARHVKYDRFIIKDDFCQNLSPLTTERYINFLYKHDLFNIKGKTIFLATNNAVVLVMK